MHIIRLIMYSSFYFYPPKQKKKIKLHFSKTFIAFCVYSYIYLYSFILVCFWFFIFNCDICHIFYRWQCRDEILLQLVIKLFVYFGKIANCSWYNKLKLTAFLPNLSYPYPFFTFFWKKMEMQFRTPKKIQYCLIAWPVWGFFLSLAIISTKTITSFTQFHIGIFN